jgi:adenosylhomocysteine nucleosidase
VPTATSEVRTLLVVAAESFELKHIRAHAGQEWIFTANGPGPLLAAEAADRVTARVDAVLSTGLCGALVNELAVGDIVVGTAVNGVPIEVPRAAGRYTAGPIVSIDHVAQTAAEKKVLSETGAVAVEMEAAAVLERARQWGVPFYCVRVVSDTAREGFALDLNAARDVTGRFQPRKIVAQAMRRPIAGVPELLRLRRNAAVAVRALGEFIGNCSF